MFLKFSATKFLQACKASNNRKKIRYGIAGKLIFFDYFKLKIEKVCTQGKLKRIWIVVSELR